MLWSKISDFRFFNFFHGFEIILRKSTEKHDDLEGNCYLICDYLCFSQKSSQNHEKNRKIENLKFWTTAFFMKLMYTKNYRNRIKTVSVKNKKLFELFVILVIWELGGTVLGPEPQISGTKISGLTDFFENRPTLRSSNFFSTEPISIFFDFLKNTRSDTFISGVFIRA